MRRSEFSRLTGLKPGSINNFVRRNELPFLRQGQKPGWGDYDPRVAFMTTLALKLADAGMTLERAGDFVNREFDDLLGQRSFSDLLNGQILFGFAKWANWENDPEFKRPELWQVELPVCGSFDEISLYLKGLRRRDEANRRNGSSPNEVHALVVVNASERLRFLQTNAADQGLANFTPRSVLEKQGQP